MPSPNPQSAIRNPQSRDGLLLIDKPPGMTSHDVVTSLRRLTGIKKIGHTGTLDPFATGLMLLLIGRATRLSQFFLEMDKEYRVRLRLGEESDTMDVTGKLVQSRAVAVSSEDIEKTLHLFRGKIQQVPPMFSAVKIKGRKLYQMARRGLTMERPPRGVSVYSIEVLHPQIPELEILVRCSSGTYIRSLVHDLGQVLGCGAIVTALCRTEVGPYQLNQATPLAQSGSPIDWKALLIPMEDLLQNLPSRRAVGEELELIRHGKDLARTSESPDTWIRLMDAEGKLIALGQVGETIHPSIVLV
jgi:tRNA pseudouridine55 synthase